MPQNADGRIGPIGPIGPDRSAGQPVSRSAGQPVSRSAGMTLFLFPICPIGPIGPMILSMKAAILHNDFDIRAGEVPDPRLPDDHVILRSEFAGICGTDLHVYRGEFRKRVSYPAVLGHEFSGTILEVGKKVRGFSRQRPGGCRPDPLLLSVSCLPDRAYQRLCIAQAPRDRRGGRLRGVRGRSS